MAPATAVSTNQLPPKENALFKRIVKCYEHKQYKNGLKFAKQILANPKYAEHGETLAMKGLILNCIGKKDEAIDHVRRGLKNDLKSHVCWHVYGLLQRTDKKYDEAIKAYRNALKIDKENLQILRDLSLLQLQMRDLDGYKETRYQLFTLRPTQRASWVTFAMAHHLLDEYDTALKILEEFRRTQQPTKTIDYEYSELLLYQNLVYRNAARYSEALEHLDTFQKEIIDKLAFLETKAEVLCKLQRYTDAAAIYRSLISRNPDNIEYYKQLESCMGLVDDSSDDAIERRLFFYDDMCKLSPRSLIPKRAPLTFSRGAKFVSVLEPYVKDLLRKGVPPLFVTLKPLYSDKSKVFLIEELFLTFADNLERFGKFRTEDEETEVPTIILWVYYYLVMHFDHLGQYERALSFLDKATTHTPTLIELFIAKAKIYKHAGDYKEAAKWMDEAQSLDTADRYVNSKCAKYMLKAGMIPEAEQMCAKFTREGVSAMDSLNEMQCMWFQTQCARNYRKRNQLGEALKKCHEVDRHFTDIIEDQFDFHTYCVRRMTLSAYFGLLRLEDVLRRHRWYFKAAKCAIKIYLRLYDKPYDETEAMDGLKLADANSSEAKKKRRKEKKQLVKAEQNKQKQQQQMHNPPKAKQDQDPEDLPREPLDPKALVKTQKPLDEALKFLKPLLQLDSRELEAYILGFEVFYRRSKVLMMLFCLKKALALDAEDPRVHVCKIKFSKYVKDNQFEPVVNEVVSDEFSSLFLNVDGFQLNAKFKEKHFNSLPHLLAVAQSMVVLDPSTEKSALDIALNLDDSLENRTWKACRRVYNSLTNGSLGSVDELTIKTYRDRCRALFPMANIFRSIDHSAANHVEEAWSPTGGDAPNCDNCFDADEAEE